MDEHQRLRRLILGEQLADWETHAVRMAALEAARSALPEELPLLLQQSQLGDGRRKLSQALVLPLTDALGRAAQEQRQGVVDALFPVIGPAIRKAIAESLRDFTEGFNRALESSFTPRGLRWRLESWRTGIPYVQVVLRHNLRFRLDHLFLIDRASGLVLARQSAADLPDLDADAIAGMLTAIGDFVRDSVGGGSEENTGTLDSVSVGEHLVWVEHGPRASFAVFLRGVAPAALRLILRQRLEQAHAWLSDPLRGASAGVPDAGTDPQLQETLGLQRLELAAAADSAARDGAPVRRWPLLLIGAVLLALLGAWFWRDWQWQRRVDAVAQRLADWPGLHVEELSSEHGQLLLRGLIDADASSPRTAMAELLPDDVDIRTDLRGYLSSDDAIVQRRAQRQLQPPEGVHLAVRQGVLHLRGEAAADVLARLRQQAGWVAGVARVDASGLGESNDAQAPLRAEWEGLLQQLARQHVYFVREVELADAAAAAALQANALRLVELGRLLQRPVAFTCHGHNDEPGTATINQRLRESRARWLCDRLAAAGIDPASLQVGRTEATPAQPMIQYRAASLSLDGAHQGEME
ncbi:hypothetical protein [Tahibacter aquaticus]|uniref:hypothetical protein n=1 Tax=Tahibacter aquaticus TaxID=520092 RepID=UPI001414DD3C|nr:hypothetical protein [Tahibacter aquaticus]